MPSPSHHVPGFIPFEFASYTRWAWALQPAWYAAGPVTKLLHALFRPLKAAVWGLFGLLFPLHTSTPGAPGGNLKRCSCNDQSCLLAAVAVPHAHAAAVMCRPRRQHQAAPRPAGGHL